MNGTFYRDNPCIVCGDCWLTQGPCLLGSGNVISETRTVEPFHSVELNGIGTLSVTQDGSPEVKLEAEDNILPVIRTRVENGILIIEYDAPCIRNIRPINLWSRWMRSGG